jgi:hypothetical protein
MQLIILYGTCSQSYYLLAAIFPTYSYVREHTHTPNAQYTDIDTHTYIYKLFIYVSVNIHNSANSIHMHETWIKPVT